jgi:hypothetical protein
MELPELAIHILLRAVNDNMMSLHYDVSLYYAVIRKHDHDDTAMPDRIMIVMRRMVLPHRNIHVSLCACFDRDMYITVCIVRAQRP